MREQSLLSINGDTHISGGRFNLIVNNNQTSVYKPTSAAFNQLHAETAVSALHNAFHSFQGERCHPKTRETVLKELLQFILDDPKTRRTWILWLSGPAGSGKTTIARTLAYLCVEKGLHQANFFFCRLDVTRNGIKPLVATLAYQIACRFTAVKKYIEAEIEQQPHIFELSVEEQFRSLIVTPLTSSGWIQDSAMARSHPIVCVIDALDECLDETGHTFAGGRSHQIQSHVVETLYKLVSNKNSPVIFILASRPEANLRMSFHRIRHSISRIYLDNSYNPSGDIRRFVQDVFAEIKIIHPLALLLPHEWPKPSTIDAIVAKSSGQFIYAATVMRYISSPWSDPATSLDIISQSLSTDSTIMLFTELDDLFSFILGRARNWPVVLTILSCHFLALKLSDVWFSLLLELAGHSAKSIQPHLIDIVSLVEMDDKQQRLVLHNESLIDFLVDPQRSGRFYANLGRMSHDFLMKVLRKRSRDDVHLVVDHIIALLPKVTDHSEELKTHLLEFSREAITMYPERFLTDHGIRLILDAFSRIKIGPRVCETYQRIWREWSVEDRKPFLEFSDFSMIYPGTTAGVVRRHGLQMLDEYTLSHSRSETYSFAGTPDRSKNQPMNDNDARVLNQILASALLSEATGMTFGAITVIIDANSADYARILSTLPFGIEYKGEEQTINFHPGGRQQLMDYVSSLNFGYHHLDMQNFASETISRLVSSSHFYKGNLFGDLGALVFYMKDPASTRRVRLHLKDFATQLLESPLDVHILDFATFLDAMAYQWRDTYPLARFRTRTPTSRSLAPTESHPSPIYIELLTDFVRFWASMHNRLDPQLLHIPEFRHVWQQVVQAN